MALLGNYSVILKSPGRFMAGTSVSGGRPQFNTSGAMRCRNVSAAGWSPLSAQPRGYLAPYAWLLPRTGGDMATWGQIVGTGTLTAAPTGGRNGEATIAGSGTLTATGELVVSGTAAIAGTSTVSANIVAALLGTATVAGTSTCTGTLDAEGYMTATLTGAGDLTAPRYATGELEAAISPFTELSPETLASNVWGALASENFAAGTMGEALNVSQIMLRNKTVTDPAAGTITVYDTDGTTVLYVADLFQDAAGTTPYAGAGAERRERLE